MGQSSLGGLRGLKGVGSKEYRGSTVFKVRLGAHLNETPLNFRLNPRGPSFKCQYHHSVRGRYLQ